MRAELLDTVGAIFRWKPDVVRCLAALWPSPSLEVSQLRQKLALACFHQWPILQGQMLKTVSLRKCALKVDIVMAPLHVGPHLLLQVEMPLGKPQATEPVATSLH